MHLSANFTDYQINDIGLLIIAVNEQYFCAINYYEAKFKVRHKMSLVKEKMLVGEHPSLKGNRKLDIAHCDREKISDEVREKNI